jgi:hypothetical protein
MYQIFSRLRSIIFEQNRQDQCRNARVDYKNKVNAETIVLKARTDRCGQEIGPRRRTAKTS